MSVGYQSQMLGIKLRSSARAVYDLNRFSILVLETSACLIFLCRLPHSYYEFVIQQPHSNKRTLHDPAADLLELTFLQALLSLHPLSLSGR